MDGLSFAFFPFYPFLLKIINTFIKNIELSSFLLANFLMTVNFFSLYYVIKRTNSEKTAVKTIFLLFFFPISIFYRSYFAEGLLLFLLIWFSYFLIKNKYIYASLFLGLSLITKAVPMLLTALIFYKLISLLRKDLITLKHALSILLIVFTPWVLWLIFNLIKTEDPFYFINIRNDAWFFANPITTLFHNFKTIIFFPELPVHGMHFSQLDVTMIIIICVLLIFSKKFLNNIYWWISLLLFVTPLISSDTMSFSRYQIVSFPLFLYLASRLSDKLYIFLLIIFYTLLLYVSILFVNWYWIG
jgi:Gpi18-like mannosyltransferase